MIPVFLNTVIPSLISVICRLAAIVLTLNAMIVLSQVEFSDEKIWQGWSRERLDNVQGDILGVPLLARSSDTCDMPLKCCLPLTLKSIATAVCRYQTTLKCQFQLRRS